jgi:hypothetical protein
MRDFKGSWCHTPHSVGYTHIFSCPHSIYAVWVLCAMLAALDNRLDALLGTGEKKSVKPAATGVGKKILHWLLPRCKVYDAHFEITSDGTKSQRDEPTNRINDVYVYDDDSRQCYITYVYAHYVLSPALPKNVDSTTVWEITMNSAAPRTPKTLKIGGVDFTMTSVKLLPWIDETKMFPETRKEYVVEKIACTF